MNCTGTLASLIIQNCTVVSSSVLPSFKTHYLQNMCNVLPHLLNQHCSPVICRAGLKLVFPSRNAQSSHATITTLSKCTENSNSLSQENPAELSLQDPIPQQCIASQNCIVLSQLSNLYCVKKLCKFPSQGLITVEVTSCYNYADLSLSDHKEIWHAIWLWRSWG